MAGFSPLSVGNASGSPFEGKIAHVAIWSTELSDAEIASLAGGTNPLDIQVSSLEAYWDLETDGSSVLDSNDMTAYNSPTYDAADNPTVNAATTYLLTTGTCDATSTASANLSISYGSGTNSLCDSDAVFHADMIGALCYMVSGDNAGDNREITGVDTTFNK